MKILLILLSLSFLCSSEYQVSMLNLNHHIKHASWIFTIGNSVPTNSYDSYGSNGFAFKVAFEKPMEESDNLRYNFGWQNISFGENIVSDYEGWNQFQIREGEKANLFDVGIKFIINEGIAGNGLFRPYINGSVGFGFFKQYTVYDGMDTYEQPCDNFMVLLFQLFFDDEPCEPEWNDNESIVVNDRMYTPFMTVDFGTQFTFHNPARYAIELGVRYSLIKNIEGNNWYEPAGEDSFVDMVGKKINADYKTIYLGLSWYFMPPSVKKRDNGGGYGKQI